MIQKKRRIKQIVFISMALTALCFFTILAVFGKRSQNTALTVEPVRNLSEDLLGEDGKIISSLPFWIDRQDGFVSFFITLNETKDNLYLYVYAKNLEVAFYNGTTLLASYRTEGFPTFVKAVGSRFVSVKLPENPDTMTIEIRVRAQVGGNNCKLERVYFGTSGGILRMLVHNYKITFLSAIILLILAIIFTVMYIVYRCNHLKEPAILYIAVFALASSAWLIQASGMQQLMILNPLLQWSSYYVFLAVLPISFLKFMRFAVGGAETRIMKGIITLSVINFFAVIGLQVTGLVSFAYTEWTSKGLVCAEVVYSAYYFLYALKSGNKRVMKYLLGISLLVGCTIAEVLHILLTRTYTMSFASVGTLGFIGLLGVQTATETTKSIKKAQKMEEYRQLALMDYTTGVGSRTAFYEFIERFAKENSAGGTYILILFDINNLKKINDGYGHLEGDHAIYLFGAAIRRIFGKYGAIYRIGGDEFVFIGTEMEEAEEQKCILEWERELSEAEELPYTLSGAFGTTRFIPLCPNDFMEAFENADKMMYVKKSTMKDKTKDINATDKITEEV